MCERVLIKHTYSDRVGKFQIAELQNFLFGSVVVADRGILVLQFEGIDNLIQFVA